MNPFLQRPSPLRPLALLLACAAALAFSPAPAASQPQDLVIEPEGGPLTNGQTIHLSFPVPVVPAARIGSEDPAPPVTFAPNPPPFRLTWLSQTEARLTILGPVTPGAACALRLADGAKSLDGTPLTAAIPDHTFQAPAFTVTCQSSADSLLPATPAIPLRFTYPVDVRRLPQNVFFLDADSRRRYPADVLLSPDEPPARWAYDEDDNESAPHSSHILPPGVPDADRPFLHTRVSVQPRSPLPPGRDWKLLVENLADALTATPLPYPHTFAIGATKPLSVRHVAALNHAGAPPRIVAKFDRPIDPSTISPATVRVQPPVPGLKITPLPPLEIEITGQFDTSQKYTVTLLKTIRSASGFGLPNDSVWGATFKPRQSSIVFPGAEIRQRSALGLSFSFLQSNTRAGAWKLAAVPPEKLSAVRAKLREFAKPALDPATGLPLAAPGGAGLLDTPTEPLIEYFNLQETASGAFDAAPGIEIQRDIRWTPPPGAHPRGPYLLEAIAAGPDGKLRGNRSLIWFSDLAVTRKQSPSAVTLLFSQMSDGAPLASAPVAALAEDGALLAETTTDSDGIARFRADQLFPKNDPASQAALLLVRSPGQPALLPLPDRAFDSGYAYWAPNPPALTAFVTTDRPICRPGEPLHAKGIIRDLSTGAPALPAPGPVQVRILSPTGAPAAEFTTPLSPQGGWEIQWTIPPDAALGFYQIETSLNGQKISPSASFQVEEIRKPLFSVELEKNPAPPGHDSLRIRSAYFHGAPNAGALVRWKSEWSAITGWDPDIRFDDQYSEKPARPAAYASASGEARLDADGALTLTIPAPFTDGAPRSRCWVNWTVDIISAEGQTITGSTAGLRQLVPAAPGITATEDPGPRPGIRIRPAAIDETDSPLAGLPVELAVFRTEAKSFKQQLAPMVFRYVNTHTFSKTAALDAKTGEDLFVPAENPGRYVVTARLKNDPAAPLVSDAVLVSGPGHAPLPVETADALPLELEHSRLSPGQTAVIKTSGPTGGIAWVTIENREILESRVVRLVGNAGRIELPVRPEYAPRAVVTVHLLSPGGPDDLPSERFGSVELQVDRPDMLLTPRPIPAQSVFEPGGQITGRVEVLCEGKPVPGAEVTLWAVDESILRLGAWQLPDPLKTFLPAQPWTVFTSGSLGGLLRAVRREDIMQKGFVIGDGGDPGPGSVFVFRENFRPLAFWAGALTSGPDGAVPFSFQAPDNLTTWRLIALAHTPARFGAASANVTVSKDLIIEPAFPRFVRSGDLIELRAVVRQNYAPSAAVTVTAQAAGGPLEILEPGPKTIEAPRGAPAILRFQARAAAQTGSAAIRFTAASGNRTDAFQIPIPVLSPAISVQETITLTIPPGGRFDPAAALPEAWKTPDTTLTISASASPFYPALTSLPALLDYPHGCLEQKSSRLLGYSLLSSLLEHLPDGAARRRILQQVLSDTLPDFERSLLEKGLLPYWPGASEPSPFVTVQTAWMLHELRRAGFTLPGKLTPVLTEALPAIAAGAIPSDPETQALALYIAALAGTADPASLRDAADSLFLRRDRLSIEARAFLALALHTLGHNTPARDQLLAESSERLQDDSFDPRNFRSLTRSEAVRITARALAAGRNWTRQDAENARARLLALTESGLSTQEQLWTLFALRALPADNRLFALYPELFKPAPSLFSPNRLSAAWDPMTPDAFLTLTARPARQPLTWVLNASLTLPRDAQDRASRGIRLERVTRNLTDPARTGTADNPFRLGDHILITYRLVTDRPQHYLALEDPLPAILETVNPALAEAPAPPPAASGAEHTLSLSHAEYRDHLTRLYFNHAPQGSAVFSITARVSAVGRAEWPGASATPMYHARWSGRGARSEIYSAE